jgi:hypothetical protein
MHSFSMRPAKYFYDKPLSKYLDPKTVLIYRPHPVYGRNLFFEKMRTFSKVPGKKLKFFLTMKQVRHRKVQDLTIFRKCLLKNFHKKVETLQAAKIWHGTVLVSVWYKIFFLLRQMRLGFGRLLYHGRVSINPTCFRNSTCRLHTLQQHFYRACGIKERIKYFKEIIFLF